MYKSRILVIILAVLIVGGTGLYFFSFRELDNNRDKLKSEIAAETRETAVAEVEPPAGSTGSPQAEGSTFNASEPGKTSGNRFISKKYGFSFELPDGFKTGTFQDGKGETVVVNPSTSSRQGKWEVGLPAGSPTSENPRTGFQIYIVPFDTEGPLTAQFIRSEVPDMSMRNVKTAKLDSVTAVVFESENESLASTELGASGQTFEVWFAYPESPVPHGNYLFQITAYKEFAGEMTQILQTWKFE